MVAALVEEEQNVVVADQTVVVAAVVRHGPAVAGAVVVVVEVETEGAALVVCSTKYRSLRFDDLSGLNHRRCSGRQLVASSCRSVAENSSELLNGLRLFSPGSLSSSLSAAAASTSASQCWSAPV